MSDAHTLRRKRFVHAYLGEANGNATQAAIVAGYSAGSAKQQGSRLLTNVDVQQAIQKHVTKADFTVEQSIRAVADIARTPIAQDQVTAKDVLKANELFLDVHGKLGKNSQHGAGSRIQVNIGFLQAGQPGTAQPAHLTIDVTAINEQDDSTHDRAAGMASLPQVLSQA